MSCKPDVSKDPEMTDDTYRRLFSDTPNAIVLRDAEGVILKVNASFERLFCIKAEDAVGKNLKSLLLPPDHPADGPGEWSDECIASRCETRRLRGDGEEVEVSMSFFSAPLPGADGNGKTGAFVIYRDITRQKQNDALRRSAEIKYKSIFEHSLNGIFQTTPEGGYINVNPALARIYGFASPAELIEHFKDIKNQLYVEPGRRDDFTKIMRERREVTNFESQIRKKDGEIIWITENARAVFDENRDIAYYEGTVTDITERKRAEEALEVQRARFSRLFANSPQAIALIDLNRNVVDCNKAFENLFGYRAEDIKGFGMRPLIVPDDLLTECENFRNSVLADKSAHKETLRRRRSGRIIPVSVIGFPLEVNGETSGVFYIYQDISERKAFEEQITHQAFHDALTGLPNRTLFAERLERALERGKRREGYNFAVLMVDLNKFKAVNDSLGHQAGDELLVEFSKRLRACVRAVDTVARLGGDEFAVILEEFASSGEVLGVAGRIRNLIRRPYRLAGAEVTAGASIGVVLQTRGYASADNVLRDADIAMYRAKERGEDCLVFDKKMHLDVLETINLETDLRAALDRDELALHYQPIVSVEDETLTSFEALIRWEHPNRGLVPPDKFIPLAEESGLIVPIGEWVITEACRTLREWVDTIPGAQGVGMSVNVSSRQFPGRGLVRHVAKTLADTGLDPSLLKLEVTESVIMQDTADALNELHRLKALGVLIAIDDFGTGYSSLSYLRRMPIDHLKIDRSFISGGGDNPEENLKIIKSIVSLARTLNLKIIAEGVENEKQLEGLRLLGCDRAQGYMFSRPKPRAEARELIANHLEKRGTGIIQTDN